MTVEEIIREAYEDVGEPPDLRPWTIDATGVRTLEAENLARWYSWVNEGLRAIVNWKSLRRQTHWRGYRSEAYFTSLEKTYTLLVASSSRRVFLSGHFEDGGSVMSTAPLEDVNKYRGYVLEHEGVQYIVEESYYSGADLAMVLVLDGSPLAAVGDEIILRRAHYDLQAFTALPDATTLVPWLANQPRYLTADGAPIEVLEVLDVESAATLGFKKFEHLPKDQLRSVGTPSYVNKTYLGLTFDVAPSEERQYRVTYRRQPRPVVALDEEPELLEHFHPGLKHWCIWKGLLREGEATRAYAKKQDFEGFMESTQNELEAGGQSAQWRFDMTNGEDGGR